MGIGFLIYRQGLMGDSIRTVFNNAGNLMENGASKSSSKEEEEPLSIPDLVGRAIAERNGGLGSLLLAGSTHYVYSGTDEGTQLAVAYYSAAENGPVSKHAVSSPGWNWRVKSSGEISTQSGEHISVPARYYVYDPVTGKQITSGYYSSQKTATLVYAPGAGKEYTIR